MPIMRRLDERSHPSWNSIAGAALLVAALARSCLRPPIGWEVIAWNDLGLHSMDAATPSSRSFPLQQHPRSARRPERPSARRCHRHKRHLRGGRRSGRLDRHDLGGKTNFWDLRRRSLQRLTDVERGVAGGDAGRSSLETMLAPGGTSPGSPGTQSPRVEVPGVASLPLAPRVSRHHGEAAPADWCLSATNGRSVSISIRSRPASAAGSGRRRRRISLRLEISTTSRALSSACPTDPLDAGHSRSALAATMRTVGPRLAAWQGTDALARRGWIHAAPSRPPGRRVVRTGQRTRASGRSAGRAAPVSLPRPGSELAFCAPRFVDSAVGDRGFREQCRSTANGWSATDAPAAPRSRAPGVRPAPRRGSRADPVASPSPRRGSASRTKPRRQPTPRSVGQVSVASVLLGHGARAMAWLAHPLPVGGANRNADPRRCKDMSTG